MVCGKTVNREDFQNKVCSSLKSSKVVRWLVDWVLLFHIFIMPKLLLQQWTIRLTAPPGQPPPQHKDTTTRIIFFTSLEIVAQKSAQEPSFQISVCNSEPWCCFILFLVLTCRHVIWIKTQLHRDKRTNLPFTGLAILNPRMTAAVTVELEVWGISPGRTALAWL